MSRNSRFLKTSLFYVNQQQLINFSGNCSLITDPNARKNFVKEKGFDFMIEIISSEA